MRGTPVLGVIAFLVAGGTTWAVMPVLRRAGLFDVPTHRSSHDQPTLRGGGIGAVVGALVAIALSSVLTGSSRMAIVAYSVTCGAIGLSDDVVHTPIAMRLVFQIVAAAVTSWWLLAGAALHPAVAAVAVLLIVVWLVGLVNAFNFFDGIDGIAVMQTVVAGSTWYIVGLLANFVPLSVGGICVAGAAAGFGLFNFPVARVFLGDVGSYFLGGWLAALAVLGVRAGVPPEAVVAPLLILLVDTSVTRIRLIVEDKDWCTPHRGHIYQRLTAAGWSHVRTTITAGAAMTACGILAAASVGAAAPTRIGLSLSMLVVSGGYLALPRWVSRTALRSHSGARGLEA